MWAHPAGQQCAPEYAQLWRVISSFQGCGEGRLCSQNAFQTISLPIPSCYFIQFALSLKNENLQDNILVNLALKLNQVRWKGFSWTLQIKQVKFIHNAFSKISFQQWSTLFEPKGELYSVHEYSEKYPIISVIHSINLYFILFKGTCSWKLT